MIGIIIIRMRMSRSTLDIGKERGAVMSIVNTLSLITFTISIVGIINITTTLDIGKERGAVMSMKNLVNQIVRAPTANPCREQIA